MTNIITKVSPTKLKLDLTTEEQITKVKSVLTFTDKAAKQALERFKKNKWFIRAKGEEAFYNEIEKLKAQVKQCLLLEEPDGLYCYSGLEDLITKTLQESCCSEVEYPEEKLLPWENSPKFELHYFQKESVELLLQAKHAGVEIATGLGKSAIITHLVKRLGLKTLVMAPSSSIAEQLYENLVYHFGKKKVGKCFGGKKEYKKLITVALPQTLIQLEQDSEEYIELSKSEVCCFDESHTFAAKTLAEVCFGVASKAPYRFFFSATQMRNDGKDLLLEAITGKIVYTMTAKQGVDEGFIAKPIFKMVRTTCDTEKYSEDPNELTRHYLYYNPKVIKQAAELANNFVQHLNHQVLILVDEVEQFSKLLPFFKFKAEFAHGPLGENKKKVPEAYWESRPNELVEKFNNKEIQILVGTSAVAVGTDFRTVRTIIYLMGGKSEIQVKQAIGRGTRKVEDKTFCNFIDFDVENCPTTHRHANARAEIYDDVYGPVEYLTL